MTIRRCAETGCPQLLRNRVRCPIHVPEDWTALDDAAERRRREAELARGLCPDSGLQVHACHRGPCDCFAGDACQVCFPVATAALAQEIRRGGAT